MTARRRNAQAGMTIIEVAIAVLILGVMMTLGWRTISTASDAKRKYEAIAGGNQELRLALGRVVADLEAAYLSKNEDENATHHRTLMHARKTGKATELRFSTFAHQVLWADARESEQTQVFYFSAPDRDDPKRTNWMRREQRRVSNENPEEEPAELDILLHDIESVEILFWDWRDEKWEEQWDTTAADAQKGRLPTRVKVVVTMKLPNGQDYKLTTQARILLQEPLLFLGTN